MEDQAKKLVDGTNSGTDVLRLYNKWHEKVAGEEDLELDGSGSLQEHKEKKGLLQKVKNAIRGKDEVPLEIVSVLISTLAVAWPARIAGAVVNLLVLEVTLKAFNNKLCSDIHCGLAVHVGHAAGRTRSIRVPVPCSHALPGRH